MKTLSLTNLDRITKLDFNLSSNTNAVGGRLSISKFKNLEVLKATYNDLTKFTFSTSNNVTLKELDLSNNLLTTISDIGSLVNLETLDLSNNHLPVSVIDSILAALDTNGITNGNVELGGNALPTDGNNNTALVSLRDDKGWGTTINGGIDTSFTAAEGYVQDSATFSHPDWEGGLINGTCWENDPANEKITTSTRMRSIRTKNPISTQVGDTVNVSMTFDYGNNALQIDDTGPAMVERTLLIALADVGDYVGMEINANAVLNKPNLALMTKFHSASNNPSNPAYIKLYQKFNTGNSASQEIVGNDATWQPLSAVNDQAIPDKFTITLQIEIGASKETSTVNVLLNNDDDGNSLTGSYTLANYADMYASLISPTSTIKFHIQSGELDDVNIDEINIYNVTARVN